MLVVDDDEDALALVAALLSRRGATVFTATSTAVALERLAEARPHVVVSDLCLPGGDSGALLAEQVRARHGDLPVVACTGHIAADLPFASLAAGFDAHVAKPFTGDTLARAIAVVARRDAPP